MQQQTMVITGASSGIGRAAARAVAISGAHVVLVVRDGSRGTAVSDEITRETGDATRASVVVCDLSSFASVRSAAALIASEHPRVDVLVNNAGLIAPRRELTEDGNELTFQVNHLSHFLLTGLLRPALGASAHARVINVSSDAHLRIFAGLDFDDLTLERGWASFKAYSTSKLANVMFTYELARRLEPDGTAANVMHPGVVRSGFGGQGWGVAGVLWERLVPKLTAAQGAQTLVMLATSPEVEGVTGRYFFKERQKRSAPVSYDLESQKRLWEVSMELTSLPPGTWNP